MPYWVAHTRGPNFALLEKRGFVIFYPEIDDYVFLKVSSSNEALLKRQIELCVHFVREGNDYVTIQDEELERMKVKSVNPLIPGAQIQALIGVCENLDGEILSREGDRIRCRFQGFNRTYEWEVSVHEVVLKGKRQLPTIPDEDLISA